MIANGRFQLRLVALDVHSLSDGQLCAFVAGIIFDQSLTIGLSGFGDEVDCDHVGTAVLIDGHPMTDAGRDRLRKYAVEQLERIRTRQATDKRFEELDQARAAKAATKRPDIGVASASVVPVPHTNE